MLNETSVVLLHRETNSTDDVARTLADSYRVIEMDSAEDSLDQLADELALVVVDLESLGDKGIEAMQRLKSKLAAAKPTLAITRDGDVRSAVEAMKLGADDCLEKPVDPDHLQEVISQLIHSRPSAQGNGNVRQAGSDIDIPPGTSLEDLERAAVQQALAEHQGNRTHAAKTLGISVRTLQRKLKAWGLPASGINQTAQNPTRNPQNSSQGFVLPAHRQQPSHHSFS